jgi:hypothetical protein
MSFWNRLVFYDLLAIRGLNVGRFRNSCRTPNRPNIWLQPLHHPPDNRLSLGAGSIGTARDARRNLRLVHRGLRHRRPEGRQGVVRRAGGIDGDAVREVQLRQPRRRTVLVRHQILESYYQTRGISELLLMQDSFQGWRGRALFPNCHRNGPTNEFRSFATPTATSLRFRSVRR